MKDNIERFIDSYIETAKLYGEWMEMGEFEKAVQFFESNQEISKKLLMMGPLGGNSLSAFLDHDDPYVRVMAASHLMGTGNPDSINVLKQLKNNPGFSGFYSTMILDEHSK